MISIIMLGAPGSGKGTQMQLLSKYYNIPSISTGDVLRKKIRNDKKFAKCIKNVINQGKLIKDHIIIKLIKKRIKKSDCKNGFILDGFPRTIMQAKILKNKLFNINYALHLQLSKKKIFRRIQGRLIHEPSGRCYHKIFNPPKKKNIDDITGELLSVRKDDKINVIKTRLKEYKKYTIPLIYWLHHNMKKKKIKIFEINTDNSIKKINKKIIKLIQKK